MNLSTLMKSRIVTLYVLSLLFDTVSGHGSGKPLYVAHIVCKGFLVWFVCLVITFHWLMEGKLPNK